MTGPCGDPRPISKVLFTKEEVITLDMCQLEFTCMPTTNAMELGKGASVNSIFSHPDHAAKPVNMITIFIEAP